MDLKLSVLTDEFIRIPVEAREGSAAVNPTALPVSFAFKPAGTPVDPTDFTTGAWETDGTAYFARIRVGGVGTGATKELTAGKYTVWLKIVDSSEQPIRPVGLLEMVA